MTTVSDDIKTALEADHALMALLTGGIYNDVEEISPQLTPGAFNATTKEIMPCALIKVPTEVPNGPYITGVRTTVVIYVYQRRGYGVIDPASQMIYNDLNYTQIGTGVWELLFTDGVPQQRDAALDCALGLLRFSETRDRQASTT
jgi:hypothetical protein